VAVTSLDSLKAAQSGYFVDSNIRNLVAFHPSFPVQERFSSQYRDGMIILQDKASCISADLLEAPLGARVLDACAAPGNKTTQLAVAVGRQGHVFAVEKDSTRASTLKNMVAKAGASKCTNW
jgi:25S rRNA (cytosine2278-C5)-methyltransferase